MLGRLFYYGAQKNAQAGKHPKSPSNRPMEFDQPKEKAVGSPLLLSGAVLMTLFLGVACN